MRLVEELPELLRFLAMLEEVHQKISCDAVCLSVCAIAVQVRRYLTAEKGEPVQLYGTEGEDLGEGKIASIEECHENPLEKGTKIKQFCIDDASTQYCTKAGHFP